MKQSRNYIIDFAFVILFLVIVIFSIKFCIDNRPKIVPVQIADDCVIDTFCVKDFILELHIQDIKHPEIVLRQACLESSFFTSSLWRRANNPFGFFYKGEYLTFNHWKDAVDYYKTWQNKRYEGGNYYLFLDRIGYAEDSLYEIKVKNINLNTLR